MLQPPNHPEPCGTSRFIQVAHSLEFESKLLKLAPTTFSDLAELLIPLFVKPHILLYLPCFKSSHGNILFAYIFLSGITPPGPERSGLAVSPPSSLNLQLPEEVLALRKGSSSLDEYTTEYQTVLRSPHPVDPAPKSHLGQSEMGAFPTERSTSLLDATTFSFDSDHFQLRMENRTFLFCFVLKCLNIQNHKEELSILVLTCTSSPFPCPDSTKSSKNWFNPHPSWLIKSQPQSHTHKHLWSLEIKWVPTPTILLVAVLSLSLERF